MVHGSADLIGHTIDGRYRIERLIGSGGMGTVFCAKHVQTLQDFAVKTLRVPDEMPEGAIQRCLKEARAAASLRSKHIVRITDVQPDYRFANELLPYIVMELLEGTDLESLIAQRGVFSLGEARWVVGQLCRGIKVAHEHGIVHRDLKPANLFLTADEDNAAVIKICDFGLAKLTRPGAATEGNASESGIIAGTPRYMAPEQLVTNRQVTTHTDQWAIGLIAYRLLTGRDYFDGTQNAVELSMRILRDPMPDPSGCSAHVPRGFDAWFRKSCNRDSAGRFPDVRAQALALEKALGHPTAVELRVDGLVQQGASQTFAASATSTNATTSLGRKTGSDKALRVSLVATGLLGASGTIAIRWLDVFSVPPHVAPLPIATSARLYGTNGAVSTSSVLTNQPMAHIPEPSALPRWKEPSRELPRKSPARVTVHATPGLNPVKPELDAVPSNSDAAEGLDSGTPCSRSIQCRSKLCVAERCK